MGNIVGERIKARRKELGMSQVELAEKTGYKTNSAISHIENGDRVLPQDKIIEFAKVLYTTPSYLLGIDYIDPTFVTENEKYLEMLHKNPQFRVLLDSSAKLDEKSLRKLIAFVESLSE